jgi:ubiquinone biosynthesis protein COQ9
MLERLKARDLQSLRFRDRIAAAVRLRLEAVAEHKEAVRRAADAVRPASARRRGHARDLGHRRSDLDGAG